MYRESIPNIETLKEKGYMIEPSGSPISNHVREAMIEENLSATEVSERSGVSRQSLHNILNGTFTPGVDLALKLSAILKRPVESLFQLTEDAWYSRVKKAGEKTLYVDVIEMTILDKEAVELDLKHNNFTYYDNKTRRFVTTKEKEALESTFYQNVIREERAVYSLIGQKSVDKRSVPRKVKEALNHKSESRFIPKYQKLVRIIEM